VSLQFSKYKGKVNFDPKLYFSYFLILDLRDIREIQRNPTLEREFLLDPIPTLKKVNICVNLFYLMRGVQIKCFFSLKMAYKNIFELKKIFLFLIDFGFLDGVFLLF
jgi:hypothetical protein